MINDEYITKNEKNEIYGLQPSVDYAILPSVDNAILKDKHNGQSVHMQHLVF